MGFVYLVLVSEVTIDNSNEAVCVMVKVRHGLGELCMFREELVMDG